MLSARLPCSGRLPLNIHPSHSESPLPFHDLPCYLTLSVSTSLRQALFTRRAATLVLFEEFLSGTIERRLNSSPDAAVFTATSRLLVLRPHAALNVFFFFFFAVRKKSNIAARRLLFVSLDILTQYQVPIRGSPNLRQIKLHGACCHSVTLRLFPQTRTIPDYFGR